MRDRDRLRGEHLQRLGWRYHRLWSTNWYRDPEAEVAKVQAAFERAVSGIDPGTSSDVGGGAAKPSASARSEPAAELARVPSSEVASQREV